MWPKFLTTAAITTPTTHRSFSAQSCSKLSLCRSWKVSKQAGETGGRSKWRTGSGLLLPPLFPCFVCLLTICPYHSYYFPPLFFFLCRFMLLSLIHFVCISSYYVTPPHSEVSFHCCRFHEAWHDHTNANIRMCFHAYSMYTRSTVQRFIGRCAKNAVT